jgi:hypothetical protein
MIIAHFMGIPIEESVLQLGPAGAAMVTAVAITGRASLGRLRRRLRHRAPGEDHSAERIRGHQGATPTPAELCAARPPSHSSD